MNIVHVASEIAPLAKVGGLADVLYGLCHELSSLGHLVEIVLPKYDCLRFQEAHNLRVELQGVSVDEGMSRYNNTIWSAEIDGLKILLVESHHPQHYFNRGKIYGCPDDIDRFTYFSKVALAFLFKRKKQIDILHVHDWPSAIIPVLCKETYRSSKRSMPKTLLTLHNMQHQGLCTANHLIRLGLPQSLADEEGLLRDPLHPDLINLLRGGIEYSDLLSTVSPTYEKEIQTASGGFGLEGCLTQHREKLKGILNGIDEDYWNPEIDSHLIAKYSTHKITKETLSQVLEGKKENKRHLRNHMHLKERDAPLVACVTRLVPQKGPELIKYSLQHTLKKGGQFVLLGSISNRSTLEEFEALQMEYKEDENVAILLEQDEALAHLIFAAADLFVIPSIFEPCGLTQLIALRYGTIPVARMTGGLKDTVFDIDTSPRPVEERNGFTFDFADVKGVDWALDRALQCYKDDKEKWRQLMLNGMQRDLSWKHAALEYEALYRT